MTKKNVDNVDVRRALDMAINKKAIIESVYQGAGQAATEPDAADPMVLRQEPEELSRTIPPRPRRCSRRRVSRTASK